MRVLARIRSDLFYARSEAYREEVRAWLVANGIDPRMVPTTRDVEVVLLDAPMIVRDEKVVTSQGHAQLEAGTGWLLTRTVHSLLRVPLPAHLGDPL